MKKVDEKPLVLIVDDTTTNIDILINTLRDEYRLGVATNGRDALKFVEQTPPQLILLDIKMPDMSGYAVCQRLKENPETKEIAIIFITAMQESVSKAMGLELGAVDYITKPFDTTEVQARVKTHLSMIRMQNELNNQNIILKEKVREKTTQLQTILDSIITTIAKMAEIRDPYTAGHQQRVAELACTIGMKMNLPEESIETIQIAGVLHDIGKIRIPADILNRPGKLLDAEFSMLKVHPEVGFDLLNNIQFAQPISSIVHQHHERVDGSGYPLGLSSRDILLEAKILSVADVVEAMSSHRPYRPALGIDIALEEIRKRSKTFFDPAVVEACCALFKEDDYCI